MKYLLVVIIIFHFSIVFGQTPGRIEVLGAKTFEYNQKSSGKVKKLIGDVRLKQDQTLLFCDSAYQYEERNYVEAFGRVHIQINDTTHIYGDVLKYNGDIKQARVEGNVHMNDNSMRLDAKELEYDLIRNIGSYTTGGKITNDNSVLTSRFGYYYAGIKQFYFKRDVVLTTPDYIIKGDTLKQVTTTNTTYFLGPTNITNRSDSIYCEDGWYDNTKDLAVFRKRVKINSTDKTLYADTVFYDRKREYGKALSRIRLIDKVNNIEIRGRYGELIGERSKSFITGNAFARKMLEQDSMFLIADTIFSFKRDSLTKQRQSVRAYPNAYILKYDLQSSCDSLVYLYDDSMIVLYHDPIMWSGQNQITSDTIKLYINNNKIDSFQLIQNAFMISRETAQDYNQVKGRMMRGQFVDGKFEYLKVFGNGQSIFYAKDEKDSTYLGVNLINCSEMEFFFVQNKIQRSNFITKPEAIFYPIGELSPKMLRLKGFKWQSNRRPTLKFIRKYLINNS